MGSGSWSASTFASYTTNTKKGATYDSLKGTYTVNNHQDIFKSTTIDPALDPKNVMRECCDSEEHPNTIPVILALDVTGSMGSAAQEVAQMLNKIMTDLYTKVKDVEFMIMGIGDFAYDKYPLQVSQFESDIRIAEQLDKVYFEFGGGGNSYESYSAAWYFANRHTKLDCWNRGKRGILITLGDENINPYIPKIGYKTRFEDVTGDGIQDDLTTADIYKEVITKYDIYHINVDHRYYGEVNDETWLALLDKQHYITCTIDKITQTITDIVTSSSNGLAPVINAEAGEVTETNNSGGISW